ncbi:MAG: ABC-F family ATP-binding cassette domain-containing protein [Alphaproteobacteria bacterium]
MSQPPLMSLQDVRVSFGGKPLFAGLTIHVDKGVKACLVGRNGCGKSTLLKILAGEIDCDAANHFIQPGTRIHYLPQDAIFPDEKTLLELVEQPGVATHESLAMLDMLGMNPQWLCNTLSGGQKRRVALAKALAGNPDVLLLDEPTNHLDLPTIEWLEGELKAYRGALITISHDRTFLENVSERTLWLDRGTLRQFEKGYRYFEQWQEQALEEEEKNLVRMNSRLRQENDWMHGGVTGRRKRNQRRLQQLIDLREEKRSVCATRPQQAKLHALGAAMGSKMVIEAKDIGKSYDNKCLFHDFSTRLLRGDRVGIIGPNGAGKTTLAKVLIGAMNPDSGHVRLGSAVELIYFDQLRESLKPEQTLWESLSEIGGDHLSVQGRPKHIMTHLKDFLFSEKQAHARISTLSGGERNRLALAKTLAQQGDLLVLDEPTNDLDMDTLDLLQEILDDFPGTLILISHDRDFLERLTTSIIALEGDGKILEVFGGYQDYLRQRKEEAQRNVKAVSKVATEKNAPERSVSKRSLTFKERIALEKIPQEIENMTKQCQELEGKLADPLLYSKNADAFLALSQELAQLKSAIEEKEMQWLLLDERAQDG